MNFTGFTSEDFDVFAVEGLQERMEALKNHLRVKLTQLGDDIAPILAEITGEEMHPHVAKHARRTTNPPRDSWVAWSKSRKGYKMYPHFQIGAWQTHAFIQWGLIYESPMKGIFAEKMITHKEQLLNSLPGDYLWYPDHMDVKGYRTDAITEEAYSRIAHRLGRQKNGEVMVGLIVPRDQAVRMSPEVFLEQAVQTFRTLAPLHKMAFSLHES